MAGPREVGINYRCVPFVHLRKTNLPFTECFLHLCTLEGENLVALLSYTQWRSVGDLTTHATFGLRLDDVLLLS